MFSKLLTFLIQILYRIFLKLMSGIAPSRKITQPILTDEDRIKILLDDKEKLFTEAYYRNLRIKSLEESIKKAQEQLRKNDRKISLLEDHHFVRMVQDEDNLDTLARRIERGKEALGQCVDNITKQLFREKVYKVTDDDVDQLILLWNTTLKL